jgi:geranylgeranyl diphosphate synthase type II
MMTLDLKAYIAERAEQINGALERFLPAASLGGVDDMMRYAMFPGGKRFRPVVCVAAAEALGYDASRVMPSACAWEMVHGFSLVHDDLPCMDDDDMRRGKPTVHRRYGEAEALLAGDALVIEAFRLVALNGRVPGVRPEAVLAVVEELSACSGHDGMVGGQMLDIQGMRQARIDADQVAAIHRAKTGALIRGAVRAGALLCDADEASLSALTGYAERLGLVFQITDDLLDWGEKQEVASYPAVFGVEESKRLAAQATEEALDFLSRFGEGAEPLRELARYLLRRQE